jgi:hypothetical protein
MPYIGMGISAIGQALNMASDHLFNGNSRYIKEVATYKKPVSEIRTTNTMKQQAPTPIHSPQTSFSVSPSAAYEVKGASSVPFIAVDPETNKPQILHTPAPKFVPDITSPEVGLSTLSTFAKILARDRVVSAAKTTSQEENGDLGICKVPHPYSPDQDHAKEVWMVQNAKLSGKLFS